MGGRNWWWQEWLPLLGQVLPPAACSQDCSLKRSGGKLSTSKQSMGQISCQAVPPLLKGTYMLTEISVFFFALPDWRTEIFSKTKSNWTKMWLCHIEHFVEVCQASIERNFSVSTISTIQQFQQFACLSIGISLNLCSLLWLVAVAFLKIGYVSDLSDTAYVAVPDFLLESNICKSLIQRASFPVWSPR